MADTTLPAGFADLEPFVADWAIPHEAGRFNRRVSVTPAALDAFVRAVFPRVEAMVDHLNRIATNDPDTLAPPERRLFDLALTVMECVIPSDLDWGTTDIEDAWPPARLDFLDPSWFPPPANRGALR